MNNLRIRTTQIGDVALILQFIKELAEYEHLADEVTATEEMLSQWLFEKKMAEVVIGEIDGQPVGYALFFYNFSTFLGKAGIYVEDIYVRPDYRKKGFGRAFFQFLAKRCADEGCGRLEWSCLNWNKPSIDFYLSLGAHAMEEWTTFRLDEAGISKLAENEF